MAQNDRLVTAGNVDTDSGRFSVKVPGLFDSEKDILSLPIKASPQSVVTLRDVAELRRTFKDAGARLQPRQRPPRDRAAGGQAAGRQHRDDRRNSAVRQEVVELTRGMA